MSATKEYEEVDKPVSVFTALGSLAAVVIASMAMVNSYNSGAIAVAKLEQASAIHEHDISGIERSLRHARQDQERILIVVTALAKANGVQIPPRSQMP